jgi:predicted O-methyltransferase YrrM
MSSNLEPSVTTDWIDRAKWLPVCPGYLLLRGVFGPKSRITRAHNLRRRVSSLSRVTGLSASAVIGTLEEVRTSDNIGSCTRAAESHHWQGPFRGGEELYTLVRLLQPRTVVETGVGAGVSTTFILEALDRNRQGRLVSIDLPNADPGWRLPEQERPGYLVPELLKGRWDLRLGNTIDVLPQVLNEGIEPDLFLHDSMHTRAVMSFEIDLAYRHLRKGGILLVDDALWNSAAIEIARRKGENLFLLYPDSGFAPVVGFRKSRIGV